MPITLHKQKLAATQTIAFNSSQCVYFCLHLILSFEISFSVCEKCGKRDTVWQRMASSLWLIHQ